MQDIEVLVDRIGRAAVPTLVDALLGRHHVDVFAQARLEEAPAALDVADQALGLVLRQHADAAQAGVDAVAEREVDDARLSGERHGRLGAPVGELLQPGAAPAGQHQRVGAVRHAPGDVRAR
jgi:hypothetical protein